jgi:hypothetical protein
MKDFHNVLVDYDRSKPKKSNAKKTTLFFISYDMMLKYICSKKNTLQCIKKYKYTQKRIEMILSFYKIYIFNRHFDYI